MNTNARIVTAASIAIGTASAYRDRTAIEHFSKEHGADFDALTTNAKAPKPKYEVRETQLEGRHFEMTLVERSNSNQTKFGPSILVGLYGGRLDVKQPTAEDELHPLDAEAIEAGETAITDMADA